LREQGVRAQRLVPLREVLEARVDAAVPERRRGRALAGLPEPRALLGVAVGAVGHLVLPLLVGERARHAQGLEDPLAQDVAEGLARRPRRDEAEDDVAGAPVGPERPRTEDPCRSAG